MELIPKLSDFATQSGAEGRMEGKQLEGLEMLFEPTSEMECKEEMMQTHHLQATRSKPLIEISNCPLYEGNYLSICLDKDAQRRASVELKRIDPTLRPKRVEDGDEDEHQTRDRNPIAVDMQIEQGR